MLGRRQLYILRSFRPPPRKLSEPRRDGHTHLTHKAEHAANVDRMLGEYRKLDPSPQRAHPDHRFYALEGRAPRGRHPLQSWPAPSPIPVGPVCFSWLDFIRYIE